MGLLITAGVLGFQALIFVTIVIAGAMGRGMLRLVTAGWVAFTLFGSIFTAGLLLLQLFTIAVSYSIGSGIAGHGAAQPEVQPVVVQPEVQTIVAPSHIEESSSTGFGTLMDLLILGGLVWVAYQFVVTRDQETPAPAVQAAPAPQVQVQAQPESRDVKPKPKASPRQRQTSTRSTRENSGTSDLRHCLALKTNRAIAECTERAK